MTAPLVPRVVVLSKHHRLTSYLVEQLANDGTLAGVIYEERFRTFGDTLRYLKRNAKREGFLHTLDVLAYEVFDRMCRRGEFERGTDRLLPLGGNKNAAGEAPPVFVVRDHNSPETREIIAKLEPDLLVVHACGILKEATFGLARVAALNIHCGVLPEYRGHASTFWALARSDMGNIGVSVHLVAKTVDTGLPVGIGRVPFGPDDDDMTMWFRAFREGVAIVREAVRRVGRGEPLEPRPYDGPAGPHYERRGLTQHLAFRWRTLPRLRSSATATASARVSD